jgi:hypothetical protein
MLNAVARHRACLAPLILIESLESIQPPWTMSGNVLERGVRRHMVAPS